MRIMMELEGGNTVLQQSEADDFSVFRICLCPEVFAQYFRNRIMSSVPGYIISITEL